MQPFSFYSDDTVKPVHTDVTDKEYKKLFELVRDAASREKRAQAIARLSVYVQKEFRTIPLAERRPIFAYSHRIQEIGREDLFFTFDYEKVVMKK